jgi:hypothetical protein
MYCLWRITFCLILISSIPAFSQLSGVINTYAKVTLIDETCNSVAVTPATGFSVGEKVLIIQMKGAEINQTNTAAYGDLTGTGLGSAGNYELNEIAAINGDILYLKYELTRTYDPAHNVQIVSVPVYPDVSVDGLLTSAPWDGDTGGILIFESTGDVSMNADIDVSGKGFRGGECSSNGGDCVYLTDGPYQAQSNEGRSGKKGEGVAAFSPGMERGKGKQLNGGGAGQDLNTGGGGGGNYGAGGRGGNTSSGCGNFAATNPGIGAYGFSTIINATNKIFLGGGGGGGHQDNGLCNAGGNGGGIIIIKAERIEGNGHSIVANGGSVAENLPDHGDGNGGGGAGGTILLDASVSSSFTSIPPSIYAVGGKGGNTNDQNSPGKSFGPGGGGGGGVVWLKGAAMPVVPVFTEGGDAGTARGCGCAHGAQPGSDGAVLLNLALPESNPEGDGLCYTTTPVELLSFSAEPKDGKVLLTWLTASESQNRYFTMERSEDGIHYYELARVPATNGSGVSRYSIRDELKGLTGTFYYKLSQTDVDGTVRFLVIRSVILNEEQKVVQRIYPNPFTSFVIVELRKEEDDIVLSLVDMTGRTVLKENSAVAQAANRKIMIAPEYLPQGAYILLVQTYETEEKHLLIKE